MAEEMTVESIIDAYWQIQGFFTRPRFIYRTINGAHSDIDVLAYKASNVNPVRQRGTLPKRTLVMAESKAHGKKDVIFRAELTPHVVQRIAKNNRNRVTGENSRVNDLLKFIFDAHYIIKNISLGEMNFPVRKTDVHKVV